MEVSQTGSIGFPEFRSMPQAAPPLAVDEHAVDERIETALARLARAEQELEWIKSQVEYLERRAASAVGATERELMDLMTARDELAASAAWLSSLLNSYGEEESDAATDWDVWSEY